MTAHHIRSEIGDDGIAILTIDRAEKRNAITYAMLFAFNVQFAALGADDRVRGSSVT